MITPLRLVPILATVDRRRFRLTVWRMKGNQYVRAMREPIAIGQIGHATPGGLYFIEARTLEPDWLAPDSDWVPPEKRGKIAPFWMPDPAAFPLEPAGFIPYGEENVPWLIDGQRISNQHNPFDGGFISLSGGEGIGIHGVKFDPALETRASHGCIRVETPTLLKLYGRLPIGTPIFIH